MHSHRPHTVHAVDERIQEIGHRVLSVAAVVERQWHLLARGLTAREDDVMARITGEDAKVDIGEVELDELVLSCLITLTPLASDLRRILATTKSGRELERAGDEACNAANRLSDLQGERLPVIDVGLAELCILVAQQMDDACVALVELDVEKAEATVSRDRQVNEKVRSLRRKTLDLTENLTVALAYVAIGRCVERCGDHAKVIAKLAINAATGVDPRHKRVRKNK